MKTIFFLVTLLLVIHVPTIEAADKVQPPPGAKKGSRDEVPTITVEDLVSGLRKEGFQRKFIGHQIEFTAIVLRGGAQPRIRIEGMERDRFDTAVIHHAPPENRLKSGDKVQVRGLIVDQWYGVWQIWKYEMTAKAP